mmetsp:Transcript_9812/g.12751  ORF Transcript_9812/g.12751 Transcript_9812/m.12751 type:complete len:96 (-) Transcript_9812:1044-1331(-)
MKLNYLQSGMKHKYKSIANTSYHFFILKSLIKTLGRAMVDQVIPSSESSSFQQAENQMSPFSKMSAGGGYKYVLTSIASSGGNILYLTSHDLSVL